MKRFTDTMRETMSPKAVTRQIRLKVSRDRIRYQDDEFDLDLSYITENIIGIFMTSRRCSHLNY
jgi:hypothetical protein